MGPLDSTIVSVALPKMGKALTLSYTEALWIQAAYLLVTSIFLIPLGRLADAHGRMRFYLSGTAAFGVFSMVCAVSPNGTFLIAARSFQALGAACLIATSAALVTAVFPPKERGRALGLNVMSTYLGLTAGPGIGGLIVSHASWRWIFLLNVPIALATLANGCFLLGAEDRDRKAERVAAERAAAERAANERVSAGGRPVGAAQAGGRVDWLGATLLGFGLVCLLIPLTFVPSWGWDSVRTIGMLAAAVILVAAFVFVESRVVDPLLDLGLIRHNRAFAAGTLAALLNYAGVFAIGILTSVYLQLVEGYTPQRAGVVLLVQSALMAVLSPQFGRLSDRVGSRALASGGMMLCALGIGQLGVMPAGAHPLRIVLALGTVGVGMAMFSSPNTSAVMGSVERHQLSLASSFLGTMRTLGQALSLGLLGAIAASGLGAVGARVLFLGEEASQSAAAAFAHHYRTAMFVAVGLSVLGALVSLVRATPAHVQEAGP